MIRSLRLFAELSKKKISEAIKEEARLTAQQLYKLTPPKTLAQGRKAVERDIGRVYIKNEWFESFPWYNETFGEKVKAAIRQKDDLEAIFANSKKLSKLHIEPFSGTIHEKLRRNGVIGNQIKPLSVPYKNQKELKAYINAKKKKVGTVKNGWGQCLNLLGGKGKTGKGRVDISENEITLINEVSYASSVDERLRISERAVRNRKASLAKKIEFLLKKL